MKKLSLKNLKLDGNDLLQREQLKSVFGGYVGYGGEECNRSDCENNSDCTDSSYPECSTFICTKSDGTKVNETVCMPASSED